MKFSIILPVWNCEGTIARALDSILAQEGPEVEIIFIDGGSSDKTCEIAARYKQHLAYFISEKDRGQTHAINKGFALATGDVFNWLCGDDAYQPGAFAEVESKFESNPGITLIAGGCRKVFGDRVEVIIPPAGDILENLAIKNDINQPACFWKNSVHKKAGSLNESFRFAMDWDWWNRLKRAGAKSMVTERLLADYYFPVGSKTSSNPLGNLKETYLIVKQYGPLEGKIADLFLYLFKTYDLAGCYDVPPSASPEVMAAFWRDLATFVACFGEKLIYSYNWNWMSRQIRDGIGGHSASRRELMAQIEKIHS